MKGTVRQLYLKVAHGQPMQPVEEVVAVERRGLDGDLNFGFRKRQVLLIEAETLADFGLVPGQVRENATVEGIKLAGLAAGTRLQFGLAVLEVFSDCAPCQMIEDIRPGLRREMAGRRGTLCWVVTGGSVRRGDPIQILDAG